MESEGRSINALVAATQYLQGVLLGSAATALTTIAIAGFGFLLLNGRIDLRQVAIILFGSFIVFGASSIAQGIMSAVRSGGQEVATEISSPPPPAALAKQSKMDQPPKPVNYDPYAGAALPEK